MEISSFPCGFFLGKKKGREHAVLLENCFVRFLNNYYIIYFVIIILYINIF